MTSNEYVPRREVPLDELPAVRSVVDGHQYVALVATSGGGRAFFFRRQFAIHCRVLAAVLESDDALSASNFDFVPAAPARESGHEAEPAEHINDDPTFQRPSDSKLPTDRGSADHHELLEVMLPEQFTPSDVRMLVAYAHIPAVTGSAMLQATQASGFWSAISSAERVFLHKLIGAAPRLLTLPDFPRETALPASTASTRLPTTLPSEMYPDGADPTVLPRLDMVLRLAALADYLQHTALQLLLAGCVAACLHGCSVPEMRVMLMPQLRLLPRSCFARGLGNPALPPEQAATIRAETPAGQSSSIPTVPLRLLLTREAVEEHFAARPLNALQLAGLEPALYVSASDNTNAPGRAVFVPVFHSSDVQKRVREESSAWFSESGKSSSANPFASWSKVL